jgi:riboflavin synthase
MKVSLISDSKTRINFFTGLSELLAEKIADIETEIFFVPFPEDIPAKAKEAIEEGESELVFVFSACKKFDFKAELLLSKLVDVELQTGKKIIKVIRKKSFELFQSNKESAGQEFAQKWCEFIIDYLYKPELFEPK